MLIPPFLKNVFCAFALISYTWLIFPATESTFVGFIVFKDVLLRTWLEQQMCWNISFHISVSNSAVLAESLKRIIFKFLPNKCGTDMGVFNTAGLWQSELSILISVGFELFDPWFNSSVFVIPPDVTTI